jgi:C-terminal processing protease CtpA/Prc
VTRRNLAIGFAIALVAAAGIPGCTTMRTVPEEPPPLADLEEPLELFEEPEDELERRELDPGAFTGIEAADARQTLDAMVGDPGAVRVARIVENSPADLAGIREGDLLLAVRIDGEQEVRTLDWPSEWREVELGIEPGSTLEVALDRAGRSMTATLEVLPRARAAPRQEAVRFREEERVGVVVRTATEVEARAAGLAPGGGAVIVGLSLGSPWRGAGLTFGDLIVAIDGEPVDHPQVILNAIRRTSPGKTLEITFRRDGQESSVEARNSRRDQELRHFRIPLLYSYENERGVRDVSVLLGIFRYRSTTAAWRLRLLWFFSFEGGDADRLEEVGP